VENNRGGSTRRLGPRNARAASPLSASRAALVERLREQPEPLTLASLVAVTGLHENTLREHLAALVRCGVVRRQRAEPSGRGRPAWLYELTDEDQARSEYAGLAAALAATIARTSENPGRVAAAAGEEWGRELARDRGAVPVSPIAARDQVLRVLDDLGFAPETTPEHPAAVRLTRCPLLEAAHRHREVVCGVHLGIVRGALAEYGTDPTGTALEPFAAPGACLLVVPPLVQDPS
jgi:predicted ArsR family transcriptional regulator